MKKLSLLCIILFLISSVGCSEAFPQFSDYPVQSTLNPDSGYKQWSANDQSIVITYPHTWFANSDSYAIVQLFTPLGDDTPDYREYIVFGVMQPEESDTAQSIADASWTDMKALFPYIELKTSSQETVAGYLMEFRCFGGHVNDELVGPEGDYVWYQYSFMASGLSYSITFSSSAKMEEVYKPDFDYILNELILNL